MKRIRQIVLGLAAATALSAAGVRAAPPKPVEITYQVVAGGVPIAEVRQRLEIDGRNYQLTENWKGKGAFALKGNATRTSKGTIVADGMRPQHFEDRRTGREPVQASFDPAAKTPTLQRQDQLSLFWTLASSPPAKSVAVKVADGKHLSDYSYQPAGRERVKTPAGEFEAIKFVKKRDRPDDKGTEVWLSADRRIPVRVLIVDKDGTKIDQVATKISP
jgi:hypothetical protein